MTTQERFAQDWGMPLSTVRTLVGMGKRAGQCNEWACNGDPHPHVGRSAEKARHAEAWKGEVSNETVKIADLVRPYGFTEVAYTGLFPCLKRGEQFVEIPY